MEITLREHLSKIAKDRQAKLRKKLGAKGYRAYMRSLSLKRKKKHAKNTVKA